MITELIISALIVSYLTIVSKLDVEKNFSSVA